MPTPHSNPELLEEWIKLKNMLEHTVSKTKIYDIIAKLYSTSPSTVRYWLDSNYRDLTLESRRKRDKIKRQLDKVILDVFNYFDPVSVDEISERIKNETGVKISAKDIEDTLTELIDRLGDNSPIKKEGNGYRINQNSPYNIVCSGYWKD